MKNNEDNKLDKTSDFLDLMTRSERKAWERSQKEEQKKILTEVINKKPEEEKKVSSREEKYKVQEESEVKDILKDTQPLKPLGEDQIEGTQSIKKIKEEELQVGELGKTQHILNLTSEISAVLEENIQENLFEEKKEKSSFNPITWIGLFIILCFGFFVYLVISSGYNEMTLLLIDSVFLLIIVFLFGISILCNKKGLKILSILNLLVIIAFAGTNSILLYDWNHAKEKIKENTPIKEKIIKKELTCTSSDHLITKKVYAENDIITAMKMTQTFPEDNNKTEVADIFKEQDGLSREQKENTLTIDFDFTKLDVNQYKIVMREYAEFYLQTEDFTYVSDDKLLYSLYKEEEAKKYSCEEKEESYEVNP